MKIGTMQERVTPVAISKGPRPCGEGTAVAHGRLWAVAPWKLPLVVLAIAVPIAVAF